MTNESQPIQDERHAAQPPPDVSVIIVNYETSRVVRRCVESLRAQELRIQIIVVDNPGPTDDWRNLQDLGVELVRNKENVGYGLGCNAGAALARAPLICILNPDTFLPTGALRTWVEALQKLQEQGLRPGVVAPLLLNENGVPQRSCYRFPGPLTYWLYHSMFAGLVKKLRKQHGVAGKASRVQGPRRVDWVMGSAMLIPREAWDGVGGFSADYFLYAEDTDLCFRLRKKGYEIICEPRVAIYHSQGDPAPENRGLAIERFFAGLDTFLRLNYPRRKQIMTRISIVSELSLRLGVLGLATLLRGQSALSTARIGAYRRVLRRMLRSLVTQ